MQPNTARMVTKSMSPSAACSHRSKNAAQLVSHRAGLSARSVQFKKKKKISSFGTLAPGLDTQVHGKPLSQTD